MGWGCPTPSLLLSWFRKKQAIAGECFTIIRTLVQILRPKSGDDLLESDALAMVDVFFLLTGSSK